ncbi:MAG: DoxX family protein [Bacteroidota bacterium]
MSQLQTVEVGAKEIRLGLQNRVEVPAIKLGSRPWKGYEKILFRFVFIYFVIQAVPLDWKYYRDLLSLDWSPLSVVDFFYLARYTPRFFSEVPVFADWFAVGLIAAVGTFIWSVLDRSRREYDDLYYVLRVIVRYRLALALLAYGFIKFYPIQAPFPSISDLNTNYGDLTAWKIFSLSLGIVPGYQSFLGLVEIVAALLLLNRKTASIGAFIILPLTGNVFVSNLAYEGGEYVYSFLIITFALFLFAYDVKRIARLTSFERPTSPNTYRPSFKLPWQKYGRLVAKSLFLILFVFVLGLTARIGYKNAGLVYPSAPGLAGVEGIYNVELYRVNQQDIPPSETDPVRWRDVVFEKWNTISIRRNTKAQVLAAGTTELGKGEYEYSETAGREFYSYEFDTVNHVLTFKAHNTSQELPPLNYTQPDKNTITLSNGSTEILLRKIDKKYLLNEAAKSGRRRGLKL